MVANEIGHKSQNAASGQSCETQVIHISNSDYLQMITKIHLTEELSSFYVVICFPYAKLIMLSVHTYSHCLCWTMESPFWELAEEYNYGG